MIFFFTSVLRIEPRASGTRARQVCHHGAVFPALYSLFWVRFFLILFCSPGKPWVDDLLVSASAVPCLQDCDKGLCSIAYSYCLIEHEKQITKMCAWYSVVFSTDVWSVLPTSEMLCTLRLPFFRLHICEPVGDRSTLKALFVSILFVILTWL